MPRKPKEMPPVTEQAPPVEEAGAETSTVEELVATVHVEACISANARLTDPNGVEWQLTLREGVTDEMFTRFATILPYISEELREGGWTIRGTKLASEKPATKKLSPEGKAVAEGPPPEKKPAPKKLSPVGTRAPAEDLLGDSFTVTALAMHWTDDHSQWFLRVFGGKYRKYGVRCWPEIAKDFELYGLDLSALEVVGAKYDVSDFGFVIAFSRNDEGKVSKVTSIAQR